MAAEVGDNGCCGSKGRILTAKEIEGVYVSDGPEMYAGGKRMSRKLMFEYQRQVNESEGFDITLDLDLGVPIGVPIFPRRGTENDSQFVELSRLAIAKFNSDNATNYEFLENVTVNTSYASGIWCYLTFRAKDATTDDLQTFQSKAWWGIDGARIVKFCRFKNPSK